MLRNKTEWVRRATLLCALALAVSLAGCDRTKISDISQDPGRFGGQDVTIVGRVVNTFGVLSQGAFEIDDGTGRMWVISSGFGVPTQGALVAVTGHVQSGVTLGARTFANVLRETKPRRGA